jgi:hypothetical protein
MKLKTFLLLVFLGNLFALQAQNTGTITGKVVDKNSKQPLPYVNVVIKKNQAIVTGALTQENGTYTIKNIAFDTYTLEFQFIGYTKQSVALTISENKTVTLPPTFLSEEAVQLEGVEIVKERSTYEQKIDRKVINVGKDLISAGATAGEIMNNIPSVLSLIHI